MQITPRDRDMLQWINGHGFVTVAQAAQWMGVHYQTAQRRIGKLCQALHLKRQRFEFGQPRVHWLSETGWIASNDQLTPLRNVNRITYLHDLTLVDVAQCLVDETGGTFVPERRLKESLLSRGRRVAGHLPDGILYLDQEKPIAVELEMSTKNPKKLRNIISSYSTNSNISEIWYYVTNKETYGALRRAIKNNGRFKIRNWELAR